MEDDPFSENVEGKGKYYPNAVLTNKKLLIDSSLCDLSIKIGSETIQAHAPIIAARCEELLPFVQDEKSKKRKKHEVKLKDGTVKSAAIFQRILEYIYTGTVEFPKLTNEEILYINIGARNLNLVRLVYLCERWLRDRLSMENVFHLLKAATDLNEIRVKSFCLNFALQHYTDFISNKDGIKILGIELFQEVVAAFNPQGQKQQEDFPDVPQDTYLNDFKRLCDYMPYSDFYFQIDGEQIKIHRAILAAHSDVFLQVFKAENAIQHDRISAKSCKSVIKYLYYGDEDIEQASAVELVAFCRRYKLHSLLRICEDKIRVNLSTDTVIDVLSVAYIPTEKMELVAEIKANAFPFILQNLTQINLITLKAQHPLMAIELLLKLQEASKKGEMNFSGLVSGYVPPNNNSNNNNYANHSNSNNIVNNENSNFNFPPPPKLSNSGENVNHSPGGHNFLPPPSLSTSGKVPPPPPTRGSASNLPPPPPRAPPSSLPPPVIPSGSSSARGEASDEQPPPEKALKKKSISSKDLKSELKQSVGKKEEKKREKEEQKRLEKEKKERKKMEKKFKAV